MKGILKYSLIFCFATAMHITAFAQSLIPLSRIQEQKVEREHLLRKLPLLSPFHSYYKEDLDTLFSVDSVLYSVYKPHKTWFGRKIWNESFIRIDSSDYQLNIDPMFNLQLGKDKDGKKTFVNTRGAMVNGKLGEKFSFGSWVYENQAIFPTYWDTIISRSRVAPGQGRAKRYKVTGWDYAYSGAYISWRALKSLNLLFGQGKNFIGSGYRSMILSDVSTNYPYLRIDWHYKNIQYTKLFTSFTNFYYPFKDIREFYKKTGTLQMLTVNLGNRLQVSFFDLNIWNSPDSSGLFKLKAGMFNPVPYLSSLSKDEGREDKNSIAGIAINYKPFKGVLMYGQFVFDDWPSGLKLKRIAFQTGIKYFDMLGITNLFIQAELNQAQPYMYSHGSQNLAASHFQQPLAHPLGANFREGVFIMNYHFKHIYLESRITKSRYGQDGKNENWGKNILLSNSYKSGYDNKLFQGISTQLTTGNFEASYIFNPHTNMSLVAGYYLRNETSSVAKNNIGMIYFAFRTSLSNLYYDY